MKSSIAVTSRRLIRLLSNGQTLRICRARQFSITSHVLKAEPTSKPTRPAAHPNNPSRTTKASAQSTSTPQQASSDEVRAARAKYDRARSRTDSAVEEFAATCRVNEDKTIEVLDAAKHDAAKKQVEAAYDELLPATAELNKLLGNPPLADPDAESGSTTTQIRKLDDDSKVAALLESSPSRHGQVINIPSSSKSSSKLSPNSLITNHIATASSSPRANRANILAAQAHLARRESVTFGFDTLLANALRHGRVIRFADQDEKLRAVALAQEHADSTAMKMSVAKKQNIRAQKIEFRAAPQRFRDEIVDKVVKGAYGVQQQGQAAKPLSLAERIGKQLMFNETFTKKPGSGFVETIKRLLPQATKS